jgi:hypothetical protein
MARQPRGSCPHARYGPGDRTRRPRRSEWLLAAGRCVSASAGQRPRRCRAAQPSLRFWGWWLRHERVGRWKRGLREWQRRWSGRGRRRWVRRRRVWWLRWLWRIRWRRRRGRGRRWVGGRRRLGFRERRRLGRLGFGSARAREQLDPLGERAGLVGSGPRRGHRFRGHEGRLGQRRPRCGGLARHPGGGDHPRSGRCRRGTEGLTPAQRLSGRLRSTASDDTRVEA